MSPDYSVIGRRIKTARLEQNFKQEQLADKLDISVAYMSRIERGDSKVNLRRLTQIAELLNVSPAYLLTGSNTVSKDYLKEDFRVILDRCTPEQQKLIYEISEIVSRTNLVSEEIIE